MLTIWKFPIRVDDEITCQMPAGARLLTVQVQGAGHGNAVGTPCIWALVNSEAKKEKRTFRVYGTGHPIEESEIPCERLLYVGTFQSISGSLVFHLFEVLK